MKMEVKALKGGGVEGPTVKARHLLNVKRATYALIFFLFLANKI